LKKTVLLSFVFLLFSTAVVVIFVCPVVAEETIYIRPDGTVEGTDKIQRDGNIYTFADNIYDKIVIQRDNIVIDGEGYILQGTGSETGIFLLERNNVTIKNVQIRSFRLAIELESSSGNVICGNNMTNNPVGGIGFWKSSNNTISENYIANSWAGIYLQGSLTITSDNNSIVRNYITNNTRDGITLFGCFNRIAENYITNNGNGIGIRVPPWASGASNNMIYHNNFVNNTRQIFTEIGFMIPDSINIWDDGVEGNYWSNYEERYPNATEIDNSGIWNTPYVIDENNQDNYPLVPEFPTWTQMLLTLIVLTVAIAICKRRLNKAPIHMHAL
jgi:parallel beta-helix repeat protein